MIVFGFVFGSMGSAGGDGNAVRTLFVDEDHGSSATDMLVALKSLGGLKVYDTYEDELTGQELPYTRELALQEIRDGQIGLAVVIPAGFSKLLSEFDFSGSTATLEVLADSSRQIDEAILQGMLMQVSFMTAGSDVASQGMSFMGEDLGMDSAQITMMQGWMDKNAVWGGTSGSTDSAAGNGMSGSIIDISIVDVLGEEKENPVFSHQVAGVLTMFMLFTVAASGGSLLRERQNGTIRRIQISSTSPVHYLLGKYIAFFLIAYLQTWVMLLAGHLVFRVDLISHLPTLIVFGALVAMAATSFGILLAAVCRTVEQVSSFSTLLILVMSAIGGSMLPRQFMPDAMQRLGYFTFNGWAMQGFTGIFWYEKDLGGILTPALVMAGLALVLFVIAAQLFRSRLAY